MYIRFDPNDTETKWNTSYHEIFQVNPALWGCHREVAVPNAIGSQTPKSRVTEWPVAWKPKEGIVFKTLL